MSASSFWGVQGLTKVRLLFKREGLLAATPSSRVSSCLPWSMMWEDALRSKLLNCWYCVSIPIDFVWLGHVYPLMLCNLLRMIISPSVLYLRLPWFTTECTKSGDFPQILTSCHKQPQLQGNWKCSCGVRGQGWKVGGRTWQLPSQGLSKSEPQNPFKSTENSGHLSHDGTRGTCAITLPAMVQCGTCGWESEDWVCTLALPQTRVWGPWIGAEDLAPIRRTKLCWALLSFSVKWYQL